MTRWAVAAVLVVLVLWGWLRAFAWFDPWSFCRIAIDVELLEGDCGAIRAAIDVVRREDPPAYRTLCRWVGGGAEAAGGVQPGLLARPRALDGARSYPRRSQRG